MADILQQPGTGQQPVISELEWVAEEENRTPDNELSQGPLTFITETGTARPGGDFRSVIRSQARKRSFIEKGYKASKLRSLQSSGAVRIDKSTPRTTDRSHNLHAVLFSTYPGVSRDPFNVLPIPSTSQVQSLLNHWDKIFKHSYSLLHPRSLWLPYATSDIALFNATLFTSSLDICGLQGKPLGAEVYYWKGETIRTINEKLGDENEMATDPMILAVAALTHLENLSASPENVKIHMDGLEAMVKSRGGISEIGSSSYGMARIQVGWTDTLSAIILQTEPRFAPDDYKPVEWPPYSQTAILYRITLTNLTNMPDISNEVIAVYWALRCLSSLKEETSSHQLPEKLEESLRYSEALENLERRLIPILQHPRLASPSQNLSIFTLFAHAAILHIYMFQRDLSRALPFFYVVSHRLRGLLENIDLLELKLQYPEMMLWILMMAGFCSVESSEQQWFARLFAEGCLDLGARGGENITALLSGFFWSELYRCPVTMGFWADVAMGQGFDGGFEVRMLVDYTSGAMFNVLTDTT